jgi:hypothetical protein
MSYKDGAMFVETDGDGQSWLVCSVCGHRQRIWFDDEFTQTNYLYTTHDCRDVFARSEGRG